MATDQIDIPPRALANVKVNFHSSHRMIHDQMINTKRAFFIEGGGTRGLHAIGVLKFLFEKNSHFMLDESVEIYGGTSVGSFIATALALGFSRDDILSVPDWIDLQKLFPPRYHFPVTVYRFFSSSHLYDNTELKNIIEKILSYRFHIIAQDLYNATDGNIVVKKATDLCFGHLKLLNTYNPTAYRHLIINTIDLNMCHQIFFTTLESTSYHIKLFDAMLASSALPFVFKPLRMYRTTEGVYYPEAIDNTQHQCQLYDGGLSTNNPLDYFILNYSKLEGYDIWLLKFLATPVFTPITGFVSLLEQLLYYLIGGKNEIKTELLKDSYKFNIINICSQAGTLDVYTKEQVRAIIEHIYQKCKSGELFNE